MKNLLANVRNQAYDLSLKVKSQEDPVRFSKQMAFNLIALRYINPKLTNQALVETSEYEKTFLLAVSKNVQKMFNFYSTPNAEISIENRMYLDLIFDNLELGDNPFAIR